MRKKLKFLPVDFFGTHTALTAYLLISSNPQGLTKEELDERLKDLGVDKNWVNLPNVLDFLKRDGWVVLKRCKDSRGRFVWRYFAMPLMGRFVKTCACCCKHFITLNPKQKFCSPACKVKYHIRHCEKCRKKLMARIEHLKKTGKFPQRKPPDVELVEGNQTQPPALKQG